MVINLQKLRYSLALITQNATYLTNFSGKNLQLQKLDSNFLLGTRNNLKYTYYYYTGKVSTCWRTSL